MYSFYFGNMLLPVTPEKLSLKIKGNNKTLTLANEGEINFLRQPGLTEISFEVMLPMLSAYPFSGDYHRPDYYISTFEKLMTGATPFRFIVSRVSPKGKLLFDTNMKVSLESYTITEDASKGPDVTVTITLKQYIDYATKTVTIKTNAQGKSSVKEEKKRDSSSSPKEKKKIRTHTVKRGDCLWKLAKKYYGKGSEYMKIYNANRDKIKNPNLIYDGQVLKIP